MSEYIITVKQLATVIEKCNGCPLVDKDGNLIVNPCEIDKYEVVELPEIVRCRDCKHFNGWACTKSSCSYCGELQRVEPDGFCKWGERRG